MEASKYLKSFLLILFFVLTPVLSVEALTSDLRTSTNRPTREERFAKILERVCAIHVKLSQRHPHLPIPRVCKTESPKPPTLEFYADPISIVEGENSTLAWASDHTLSCEAQGGWSGVKGLSGEQIVSPLVTTTYTLSCDGVEEGIEKSVTVEVSPLPPPPPPTPTLDHIVISEVYYLGASTNEWFEIYNGTGGSVTLEGWTISDGSSSDTIPSFTLGNNSFAIITGSTTLAAFLPVDPAAQIITLPNTTIGSGLNDTGDLLSLKNASATEVDALSYGNNVTAFNPAIPTVTAGHSIGRTSLTSDTNTAVDWQDQTLPTPGL